MWSLFGQVIMMVALFWTDLIPGFGMVRINAFVRTPFVCHYQLTTERSIAKDLCFHLL